MSQLQRPSRCSKWFDSVAKASHGRRSLANPDRPVLDRGFEQLSGVRHAHLFHHVGPMRLDGLDADLESLTDFLVLEPSPNQLKNLLLTTGEGFRSLFARRRGQIGK